MVSSKSLTPVVAVVLLTLITVALVLITSAFFSSIVSQSQEETGKEISRTIEALTTDYYIQNYRIENKVLYIYLYFDKEIPALDKSSVSVFIDGYPYPQDNITVTKYSNHLYEVSVKYMQPT